MQLNKFEPLHKDHLFEIDNRLSISKIDLLLIKDILEENDLELLIKSVNQYYKVELVIKKNNKKLYSICNT